MALSFLESNFRTRAEYDLAQALDEAERKAAEDACADKYAMQQMEIQYVGRILEMHGLKARADLNGKRGRGVRYDAKTGRVGVAVRTTNAFGGVERAVLALQPASLTVIETPAEDDDDEDVAGEGGELSWFSLCRKLGLRHLAKLHWSKHEEALAGFLITKKSDIPGALHYLEQTVGVTSPDERRKLVDALLAPVRHHGLGVDPSSTGEVSTFLRLFSLRVKSIDEREHKAQEPERIARAEKTKGVPTADSTYADTAGRTCDQLRGRIDESDNCRPPLSEWQPQGGRATDGNLRLIYPSPAQADLLAELLRRRCRMATCFGGASPRVLEAMLERRGIEVLAIGADAVRNEDGSEYYEERIYCSKLRRVGVGALLHLERPQQTALIFGRCVLTPWRAYLSRYPAVPLIIVIGDDADKKLYDPKPSDPAELPGLKLLRKMDIDTYGKGGPLTMCVYENRP